LFVPGHCSNWRVGAADSWRPTEDPHHAPIPTRCRSPPPLKMSNLPITPRWQDLPPQRQEEVLRILGRMLTEQINQTAEKGV
jgi:hypothetical protein